MEIEIKHNSAKINIGDVIIWIIVLSLTALGLYVLFSGVI